MDIFEYIGYRGNVKPYDKRIPKTQLFLHGELSKAERNLLTERVEEMRLAYVLNLHTYPMETAINSEEQYDSILLITVKLKSDDSIQRLSRILHYTVPSPTILIFELKDRYLFASALKRINQNEKERIVVEEYHYSDWINLAAPSMSQSAFLSTISYGQIPAIDYKQAYLHIHRRIYEEGNAEVVSLIDADNFDELKQKTEAQKVVQQEIERLTKLLNQKSTFLKEKVELAKQIEKLKSKIYRYGRKEQRPYEGIYRAD